jgi:hypothetical protein
MRRLRTMLSHRRENHEAQLVASSFETSLARLLRMKGRMKG